MVRPRNVARRRRYSASIDEHLAARWDAYAGPKAHDRAARLFEAALRTEMNGTGEALPSQQGSQQDDAGCDEKLRKAELELDRLRLALVKAHRAAERQSNPSSPPPGGSDDALAVARWEWPIEQLLADGGWWDRWLPRLNELAGSELPKGYGSPLHASRDARGYVDVMASLLPSLGGITWRSPGYPAAATEDNARRRHVEPAPAGPWRDPRENAAVVWEPTIRHAAEALCALESTASEGVDAYLRLRAEAEIIGSWSMVLDRLLMAKR